MDDIFPKFIIEIDEDYGMYILIGKCTYHKQLVHDKSKVRGGGWWDFDVKSNTMVLYGDSHDFGEASLDDIKECVKNKNIFTNPSCTYSIADKHNFKYRYDNSIINLD